MRFLARLMYELTLSGRACYSTDSPGIDRPNDLRIVNELQHGVSARLMKIHADGQQIENVKSFVEIFLEDKRGTAFFGFIRLAFFGALKSSAEQRAKSK